MFDTTAFAPNGTGIAPPLHLPIYRGQGTALSLEARSLGNEGMCASLSLILAFDLATGMVASHRVVLWPWNMLEVARTAVDAMKQLHVPKSADVGINCGTHGQAELVTEVRRLSGRKKVHADHGYGPQLWSDRMATELARRVANNVLFERAAGKAHLASAGNRTLYLDAVVDRVIEWHHRHPVAGPGTLSPAELHAARLRSGMDA